jgi:hypothetical protein
MKLIGVRFQLIFLLGLSACATDQWKAAEAQCLMQALPIFPVATEQRWVHELQPVPFIQRCVQVSYKDKDGKTLVRNECNLMPLMPLMAMPRLETVDLNQKTRNDYVRSCAQQSCFQTYGNTKCQLPPSEAMPKP